MFSAISFKNFLLFSVILSSILFLKSSDTLSLKCVSNIVCKEPKPLINSETETSKGSIVVKSASSRVLSKIILF